MLTALRKHNKALVSAFKAANTGKEGWSSDFDIVWEQLQTILESDDLAADANAESSSADILKTAVEEDPRDALLRQLADGVRNMKMVMQGSALM